MRVALGRNHVNVCSVIAADKNPSSSNKATPVLSFNEKGPSRLQTACRISVCQLQVPKAHRFAEVGRKPVGMTKPHFGFVMANNTA